MTTRDQSASISSAMMSGMAVCDPCPISTAGFTMYTVPSCARLAQALTAFAPPAGALASAAPALRSSVRMAAHPSIRTVNVRPAAPTMNSRRVVMALALPHGALDRAHDARIGSAAAHVRAHVVLDLCARRARVSGEKRRPAHQLTRLAVAPLRPPLGRPARLRPRAAPRVKSRSMLRCHQPRFGCARTLLVAAQRLG